ncbi:MAG: hypothetical protein JNL60_00110 [Bacteroidia bacterium]|nr:hypothetical protein [Bacteroidia bacterium]
MKRFIHSSACGLHLDVRLLGINMICTDLCISTVHPEKAEVHSHALRVGCGLVELSYLTFQHTCQ